MKSLPGLGVGGRVQGVGKNKEFLEISANINKSSTHYTRHPTPHTQKPYR
ncbi:A/G-specific adenine glycosylase [Tolypothrix sp. PCC 7601]|nr:A/G-specific adenine glycosylase [Tolypothrix sp. PCC 7601]EKF04533.1 A/G-specific adenine glycosylase [Tolypothrix sp. PCC 7601]